MTISTALWRWGGRGGGLLLWGSSLGAIIFITSIFPSGLITAADARIQLSREQVWATDHERTQHEVDQRDHDMAMDVVLGAASTAPTPAAPILSRKNRRRRISSAAPPPLASIDHEGDGTRPRRPVRALKNEREDEEGEERASPSSTALLRRGLLSSSDDHSQTQKEGEGSICASRPLLLFIIVPVPLVAIALIIFGICHCCKKDDKKKTAKENESGGQKRKNATTSSIVPGGASATTAVDFNLMRPLSMGGGADKNYAGGFDGAPNGNGTHLHSSPEVAGAGAAPVVDARDVVVIKSIGYPGSPSTSGLTSTAYREWQDTTKSGTDAFLSSINPQSAFGNPPTVNIKGQDPPSVQFPSTSSTATAGDAEAEGTATSQIFEASAGDVLPGAAAGGVKNVGLHNQEEDEARLGSTQPFSGADGMMSKANDSSYFGAEAINMSQKQDSVFAGTSSAAFHPAGQPESGTETPSSAAALGGRTRKKAKRVVMKRTKSGLKRPTSSKPPTSPLYSGVVTPSSSGQSEDDEVVGTTGSLTSAQEMSSFHNLSSAGGAGSGQSQPSKQPKEAAARLTKTPSQAPGATASDVPEKIFPSTTTLQIPPLLTTPDEGRAAEDDEDALRSYQSDLLLHSKNYNADGPSATLDSTNSLGLGSYLSVPEHLQSEGGGLGKTDSGMASFRMIIPQGLANTIKRAKRMRELGQQGKSGKDTPETLLLELERALIDGKALGKGENYKSGIQRSDDIGKSTSGAQGANQMKGQQSAPAVKALSKRLAKVLKHAAAKNKANNNKASTRGGLEDKGKKSVESPQESPRTLLDEVATALEAEEDKNEKARVRSVSGGRGGNDKSKKKG